MRFDFEIFSITQLDLHIAEYRTADIIGRHTRRYGIEAHLREDDEGRHAAAILVARNTHQVVAEPHVEERADALLCPPGRAGVVI